MSDRDQTTAPRRSFYQEVLIGLSQIPEIISRAKQIDPGAWSLNGTEPRRAQAVLAAAKEAGR